VSDWELLEAAGRAVGIVWDSDSEVWIGEGVRFDWNPLVYDGDALRLAVKLSKCLTAEAARRAIVCAAAGVNP
jgi:hypothetical protein